MILPHDRLAVMLLVRADTPPEQTCDGRPGGPDTWPDYWRGFWDGMRLGGRDAAPLGERICIREYHNGYASGDRAWKRRQAALVANRKGRRRPQRGD